MATKLSDSKFIERSIERSRPQPVERVDAADLSKLRGMMEPNRREAVALLPDAEGSFEPVSFQHPENGRRIYGWLTAVDPDGNARVEVGDGEYAVVPPKELRRLGARENREKIQADLKRAIGHVSMTDDGVRADMHETLSLMPLGVEGENLHLLSLGYSTSYGFPTEREVYAYVDRFHPRASVLEIDGAMPGRLGVAIRLADVEVEAEMGAAHGGEVQETLDPADVVEKEAEATTKQAWPFSKAPDVTPVDAAGVLDRSGQKDLIDKALKTFFDQGGAQVFIKNPSFNVNRAKLLAMAMPVVKRSDPRLWKTIAQMANTELAGQMTSGKPGQPGQPGQPGAQPPNADGTPYGSQIGKPLGEGVSGADPFAGNVLPTQQGQPQQSPVPGQTGQPTPQSGKPVAQPGGMPQGMTPDQQKVWESLSPSAKQQLAQQMQQGQMPGQAPAQPGAPIQPGAVGPGGPNHVGPTASASITTARRAGIFNRKAAKPKIDDSSAGTPTIESAIPAPSEGAKGKYDHLTKHGLPPAMAQIFAEMKMDHFARRGDYIMAKVHWTPDCMKGRTKHAIKNLVQTFVKAKAGSQQSGRDFGIIGRIHVLTIDEGKGIADVQFAAEQQGIATSMIVESDS